MNTFVLIDHNKDNLRFIKDALDATHPEVQCLSLVFADEAIKGFRSRIIQRPDGILINFDINRNHAVEFILKLRADRELKHVPVILYVNRVTVEIYRSIEKLGCTMMIEKPRTFREWKIKVQEVIESINGSHFNISQPLFFPQETMFTINY